MVPSSTALISIIYDYHTATPSLRDTSPQGEAFGLPLRGAVGNADCGVALAERRCAVLYCLNIYKKGRPMVAPTYNIV